MAADHSDAADTRCPRCAATFHCGMHDATPCACTGVQLTPGALAGLRERHSGCLCLRCLRELAGPVTPSGAPAPRDNGQTRPE